ncbi:hypothetical protein [Nonomuraea dietziae]|uniref:Uncharacterized protein n=1 Tax=Nonomuraea dietziae TaxID=65515 RepID=A0A7W5UYA6_9ACTN|nr:hypothetical protein [Nonomuraea dietziae]MBB3726912.1 hypothetical protein [Nonomuraea dietziae]
MTARRGGSRQRTALHVDGKGQASCGIYPGRTPVLALGAGNSVVSICLHADQITAESVEFARDLANAAQLWAAEIERQWQTIAPLNREGAA